MARRTRGEEKFKFAQLAAAQGERDGFCWLGVYFRDGEGCEKDLEKAKENFLRARVNLTLFRPCLFLDVCFQIWIISVGDGGAGQRLLEKAGVFWPILLNKFGCSILALEVMLSCFQLGKLCKDM